MKLSPAPRLTGVTITVPRETTPLSELGARYGEQEVAKIIKATGIREVRVARDEVCTSDLCHDSATRLLDELDYPREQVGAVVLVTQTPDYVMPATSCLLQQRLGLRSDIPAFDINYGCSGYIYGLFQAQMLIAAGAASSVLVLCGDTLVRRTHPGDRALRMVFGDAGSATLVEAGETDFAYAFHTDGGGAGSLIIPAGGCRTPSTPETAEGIADEDGNVRSREHVYMDGMAIMNFALVKVPPLVKGLLAEMEWDRESVDKVFLHQANAFIIQSLRKKLKLRPEQVPLHVDGFGNTGPASIPLALQQELAGAGSMPRRVVLAGFGVGLSWAGMTLDLDGLRPVAPGYL